MREAVGLFSTMMSPRLLIADTYDMQLALIPAS